MIYLDNNATTKPIPEAIEAFLEVPFANPHQKYLIGEKAHKYLEKSKEIIAKCINCEPDEVYFTGSATEACNWAIKILIDKNCKLIYKEYEHSAVIKAIMANYNEETDKNKNGYVQMLIQNIYGEIFKIPNREHSDDLIFMDATAAVGHYPIDFKKMNIDMLAFGAHKFNGLRGIGCLIIKRTVKPVPSLIWGGDITGGTPTPALAYAMATALQFNCNHMEEHNKNITELRDYMIEELLNIEGTTLNGPDNRFPELRAANNVNVSFKYIDAKHFMEECANYDLCISTGSACSADDYISKQGGICVKELIAQKIGKKRKPEVITVFEAGGLDPEKALNAIRITLGWENTKEECQKAIDIIKEVLEFLNPFN